MNFPFSEDTIKYDFHCLIRNEIDLWEERERKHKDINQEAIEKYQKANKKL